MLSYPLWLLIFVAGPILFFWTLYFRVLKPYLRICLVASACAVVISVPWDAIAIREHMWSFTEPYIAGIWILGVPLEEYAFMAGVTFIFASLTVLAWNQYGCKEWFKERNGRLERAKLSAVSQQF